MEKQRRLQVITLERLPKLSRRLLLRTTGAAAFAAFGAPGKLLAENVHENAIARIKSRGVLTVAIFSEDVPPFFYSDPAGNFVGVDPEIAHDIARKLGVSLSFNRNATTFDALIDEVIGGRADMVISLLSDTLERAERVTFSDSYVSVRQFLLINRLELSRLLKSSGTGKSSVPSLLNDQKAKIGVIAGTSYVGFVREDFPNTQVAEYDNWDSMIADLKDRKLTALMYDEIEIGNWIMKEPAGALELRPYFLEGHPDTIAIAIRNEDRDLIDWINLYLVKAKNTGFVANVLNRYLYTPERSLTRE